MKIQDIRPTLQNLVHFKYEADGQHRPKLSAYKSQYAYHVLLLDRGRLDVFVNGRIERIKPGDAVYLLPGEVYRLLPCGEDFSLYNLFFDFLEDRITNQKSCSACVLTQRFDASLCIPAIDFEDAAPLNTGGIFQTRSCEKRLRELLYQDRADATYCFYARAALFSVIADLLSGVQSNQPKNGAVDQILNYIRTNPEKDLSGEALSGVFSYHKNHINKLIKRETGKTLSEYVRHVKIEYAKTLLSENVYSLTELSVRLGYYDYSHFYKAFFSETGTRPTEYLPTKR